MIYIFHGDDQKSSRQAFNQYLDGQTDFEVVKFDNKEIDSDKVNNFINGVSLFGDRKILAVTNYFSITKTTLDKLNKFLPTSKIDFVIWQDKALNAAQLKTFPKAKVQLFRLNNQLFSCLNQVKPKNLKPLIDAYDNTVNNDNYDLFLYLLKGNIRKQLATYSRFSIDQLKKTYLQLIELDFQNKTGKLSISKIIALKRILIGLVR